MNGIILVDKPSGITSFGVVARMRKILNMKKVGHAGTLDPDATGVLPILVGSATRFLDYLPCADKSYDAVVKLGFETDTLDTTGKILSEKEVICTEEDVRDVLENFKGRQMQLPPMFSAVSKDGVRLYDLARKGESVERQAREIEIYSIGMFEWDGRNKEFCMSVSCSKGTYIRQLAADIGEKLGCGACLAGLRRTMSSGYKLGSCYTLEELEEYSKQSQLEKRLIPIEDALSFYPPVYVSKAQAVRFSNGGELNLDRIKGRLCDGIYRVFGEDDRFLGLGQAIECDGVLKVLKVYVE